MCESYADDSHDMSVGFCQGTRLAEQISEVYPTAVDDCRQVEIPEPSDSCADVARERQEPLH